MKKIERFVLLIFFAFVLFGCATTPKTEAAVLIEHPERMCWEIKKGDASVFILGTIHVADERFFPLEDAVLDAFDSADVLVSEVGILDTEAVGAKTKERMMHSMNADESKNLSKFLSQEEIEIVLSELGNQVTPFFAFDPWVLDTVLTAQLFAKAGLSPDSGIDLYLMQRAGKRPIEALETVDTQLDILAFGTFDEQLEMLKGTISELKDTEKLVTDFREMAERYLANDRKGLGTFIRESEILEGVSKKTYTAYIDAVYKNRNAEWAKKFEQYLNAGGKTFVFAGAGHFIGSDSVFVQMRKNGSLK